MAQLMTLGERIRARREAEGLTQEQAAAAAGIHQTAWSHVENDRREPRLTLLRAIADALGCTVGDLVD